MRAILKRLLTFTLSVAMICEALNVNTISVKAASNSVSFDFKWDYDQSSSAGESKTFKGNNVSVFQRWYKNTQSASSFSMTEK